MPQGFDDVGREVLTFLDGDVAIPPYPEWAQSDAALGSIARLIARMHRSSVAFDPAGCRWSSDLADPATFEVLAVDLNELRRIA